MNLFWLISCLLVTGSQSATYVYDVYADIKAEKPGGNYNRLVFTNERNRDQKCVAIGCSSAHLLLTQGADNRTVQQQSK